jgi:hypothetical protein
MSRASLLAALALLGLVGLACSRETLPFAPLSTVETIPVASPPTTAPSSSTQQPTPVATASTPAPTPVSIPTDSPHSNPPYAPLGTPRSPAPGSQTSDPPVVDVWVADYRPTFIGYITADGRYTIVQPDGRGGTRIFSQGTYAGAPPRTGQDFTTTYALQGGALATIVYRSQDQAAFNGLLAEWQQQLRAQYAQAQAQAQAAAAQAQAQAEAAAYAGPCTVGVLTHDMRMTFSGELRHAWCDMLTGGQAPMLAGYSVHYGALAQSEAGLALVCQVELPGEVSVRVFDSGGHLYGSAACSRLDRLAKDPAPRRLDRWAAVADLLNAVQAVSEATPKIGSQSSGLDAVLSDYATGWQREQAAYAKLQTAAANGNKPLSCSQLGAVRAQSASVATESVGLRAHDAALDASLQRVASMRKELAAGLATLDNAIGTIAATSPSSVTDAQEISQAGHAALESSDAAVAQAQRSARDYDDQAAALNQQGQQLVASLSCH